MNLKRSKQILFAIWLMVYFINFRFGSNVEKENGQEEQKVCVQMDDYRIKLNEYEENLNKQFVFKNELSIELVILELKVLSKFCF